jgi:hypothetical protein
VLAPPQEKLGELLVEAGALATEQLEAAIVESRRLGKRLGAYLVEEGMVTPEDLAATLLPDQSPSAVTSTRCNTDRILAS